MLLRDLTETPLTRLDRDAACRSLDQADFIPLFVVEDFVHERLNEGEATPSHGLQSPWFIQVRHLAQIEPVPFIAN